MPTIVNNILVFCSLVTSIAAVWTVFATIIAKAKSPNAVQDARIEAIELKLIQYDKFFLDDNKRLNTIEESNRIVQKALLAIMSHEINGNDVDKLEQARADLEHYLIAK